MMKSNPLHPVVWPVTIGLLAFVVVVARQEPPTRSVLPAKSETSPQPSAIEEITFADLPAALDEVAARKDRRFLMTHARRVASLVSSNDLSRALTLAAQLENVNAREPYRQQLLSRLAVTGPETAMAHAIGLPPGGHRIGAVNAVLGPWATRDPDAVLAWAESMTEPDLKAAAINRALTEWSARDPEIAARLLKTHTRSLSGHETSTLQTHIRLELGKRDPERTVRDWLRETMPMTNDNRLHTLLGLWLERDEAAFFAWFQSLSDKRWADRLATALIDTGDPFDTGTAQRLAELVPESTRGRLFRGIYRKLARNDLSSLQTLASKLPPGPQRDAAIDAVIENVNYTDRDAAVRFLLGLRPEDHTETRLRTVLYPLARANASATVELLKKLPESPGRREAIMTALRAISERSPDIALTTAGSLLHGRDRVNGITTIIPHWAARDLPAVIAYFTNRTEQPLVDSLYPPVIKAWSAKEPKRAAHWLLEQTPDGNTRAAAKPITEAMIKRDPPATATFVRALSAGSYRAELVGLVVREWIHRDSEKAEAWLDGFDEGVIGDAVARVVNELAREHPELAARLFARSPENRRSTSAATALLVAWAQKDPAAAWAWLKQLDYQHKDRMWTHVLNQWAGLDPATAAGKLSEIKDDSARRQAAITVINQWARKSPEDALNHALTIADQFQRRHLTQTIITSWSYRDSEAVARWIATLPAGPLKDECIEHRVSRTYHRYPERAVEMIAEISSATIRNQQYYNVCRQWLHLAPTEAKSWIEKSSLPEEVVKRLLK